MFLEEQWVRENWRGRRGGSCFSVARYGGIVCWWGVAILLMRRLWALVKRMNGPRRTLGLPKPHWGYPRPPSTGACSAPTGDWRPFATARYCYCCSCCQEKKKRGGGGGRRSGGNHIPERLSTYSLNVLKACLRDGQELVAWPDNLIYNFLFIYIEDVNSFFLTFINSY